MKVLHFGRFRSAYFGGVERHVELLLKGLSAHIEVENLVANDRWAARVARTGAVTVHYAPSLGTLAGVALAPSLPLLARRIWGRGGFDIAHLHLPDPLSQLAASLLPRSARIVVTWHSDIVRQTRLYRAYRPFLRRFLRRVGAIVAATPRHFETSAQLAEVAASAPRRVIPYGIEAERYEPTAASRALASRLRDRIGASRLVFAVGRHVYYKGFDVLIRAMRDVDGALVLGGTGPLLERHQAISRSLGLEDKVVFPGRIPDEELPAHYQAADVFCLPSTEQSEAFGLVQLEAMASGLPVVCCELGNGVNYVNRHGETGLAVPVRDAKALAAALNGLLRDEPLRRRMGAAARARARGEFSFERMVEGHLALYRELLR